MAYALAGSVLVDLKRSPIGKSRDGRDVFIGHIWPSADEVRALMKFAMDPETFELYSNLGEANPLWKKVSAPAGQVCSWPKSTYIAEPPFFKDFAGKPRAVGDIAGAKVLGIFGDSVTTDHISPAGSIKPTSPAGIYLQEHDVAVADFNSYGARRGSHEVMMRGTFANVRIKNLMLPGTEGGITLYRNEKLPIYEAAMRYIADGTPTVVFGGEEYGTGSSRDWAAKGTHAPRREGRDRAQLRAHSPREPGRHGCAAAAVHRDRTRPSRSGSMATRRSISGDSTACGQQDLKVQITYADGRKADPR